MGGINCEIVDINLFSGSLDTFRTVNGGFWYIEDTDDGSAISFEDSPTDSPVEPKFDRIFLSDTAETIDSNMYVPNKKIAVRIASNGTDISSDEEWSAFFLGKEFGETKYPVLFNESVFQYFYFRYDKPYSQISASTLTDASNIIQISYDYSDYLPEYQNYIYTQNSELLIPNYYIMSDLSRWNFDDVPSPESLYPDKLMDYVTLEGTYDKPTELFAFNIGSLPSPAPPAWVLDRFQEVRKRNTNLSIEYLTSSYIKNELSSSTANWVQSKLQTMLFDKEALDVSYDLRSFKDCLPYKLKITFPKQAPGALVESINDNHFTQKFLKTLYGAFAGTIEDLAPTARNYIKAIDYYSGSVDGDISFIKETEDIAYNEIDYIKFLAYCYNNYTNEDKDCMFVGEKNIYRVAATENSSTARHINTRAALGTLHDAINFMGSNATVTEWDDLYSAVERHTETAAYRIEKIGGPPTGDSNTQNVLQNFWFINSENMDEFEFYDSQIKYDTTYTYNVYAYVLSVGIKYNFSDLRLTRDLGISLRHSTALEFYDPHSDDNERADRLFNGTVHGIFDYSIENTTYATAAQLFSEYPYLADFYINYEPSIKIIEVPLFSKTLKVLDNPTNKLNVRPYQLLNASQKMGFDLVYNSFTKTTFPVVISEGDQTYKQDYLHGQDLYETYNITKESISKPRYLEVYRLSERPNSITDFDNNLRTTIDLKIKNQSKNTHLSAYFEEHVAANKKYYYLFRVLNQQYNLSHLSEIYEAQLINDGGYLYSIFNAIMEPELEQKAFIKPSKDFKKIFQLQPNLSQLQFNTDNIDYSESANQQIKNLVVGTAGELIWDKTFKIRLTSKKTGRKIDLNITYNLSDE